LHVVSSLFEEEKEPKTISEDSAEYAGHLRRVEKIKEAILKRKVKVAGQEVPLSYEIVSHFSRNFKRLFKR